MSLNKFSSGGDLVEKPWMDIGCHNLHVYGSFEAPDLKVDSIHVANGSLAAPSISYQNDPASGLLLNAPGNPSLSVSGNDVIDVLGDSVRINKGSDNATVPPLHVRLSSAQGQNVGNEILVCSGGGHRISLIDQNTGSSIAPQLQFTTGLGGIISSSLGTIKIRPNGSSSNCLEVSDTTTSLLDGSVVSPSLRFVSDGSSGLSLPAVGQVSISAFGQPGLTVKKGTGSNSSVIAGGQVILPQNATNGFMYIPNIAGGASPTGVPESFGSATAMTVDITNNLLWVYCATGWRSTALT